MEGEQQHKGHRKARAGGKVEKKKEKKGKQQGHNPKAFAIQHVGKALRRSQLKEDR